MLQPKAEVDDINTVRLNHKGYLVTFLALETSWQSLQVVECATQVGFMAKGVMYALIGGLCCQNVSKQAMRATNKLVSEHW